LARIAIMLPEKKLSAAWALIQKHSNGSCRKQVSCWMGPVIPAEKARGIMLRLQVKPENRDDTEPNKQPDGNFNKFDRPFFDIQ